MIFLRWLKRKPVVVEKVVEVTIQNLNHYAKDLALEFWGYSDPTERFDPNYVFSEPVDLPESTSSWVTREDSQAIVDLYKAVPLPRVMPKGALYIPRSLKADEKMAVRMTELLDGVTLAPALAKKKKEFEAGPYRVYWDKNGNVKRVPKKYLQEK